MFFADMRKALSRDVQKKSVIPLTHPVRPEDIEWFEFGGCNFLKKDLFINEIF